MRLKLLEHDLEDDDDDHDEVVDLSSPVTMLELMLHPDDAAHFGASSLGSNWWHVLLGLTVPSPPSSSR